jgi:hypothetical protein
MFSIEKFTIRACNKKLTTIRIFSTIRLEDKFGDNSLFEKPYHTKKTSLSMFKNEIFIREFSTINTHQTSSISLYSTIKYFQKKNMNLH